MQFRDRIKEFSRIPARKLVANPKNWRIHTDAQRQALRAVMNEIGFAGAVLARPLGDGRYMLIDGHLRAEENPDEEIPTLVLDVTEEEADKLLATFDPLSAMAQANGEALESLLSEVETTDGALAKMLSDLSAAANCVEFREHAGPGDDKDRDGQYPITPVSGEQYKYAMIVCSNESDWSALQTTLNIRREQCYKSKKIALGQVVTFSRFLESWNTRDAAQSGDPVEQTG